MKALVIEEAFSQLYGKPCWQVKQGYGSFLTFEFGEPHLHIREPKPASEQASAKVRKLLARRQVTIHGDWHLWIYLCDWQILSHGQAIANSESDREVVKKALPRSDRRAWKLSVSPTTPAKQRVCGM